MAKIGRLAPPDVNLYVKIEAFNPIGSWTALAQGKGDEALTLMRSAADLEDKIETHIVTPGMLALKGVARVSPATS